MGLPMMPRPMNPMRSAIHASIAASVISSARSMISNPSASCSSLMHSGGFVITFHQRMNVASPLSIRNRLSCCIVSFIWLNGDSGSIVSRFFTSSRMPNSPMLRVRPTLGCFAARASWCARMTGSSRFALPDQVVVLQHVDRGDRGGHAERVGVVGEPAPEHVVLEVRGDLRARAPRRRAARRTTSAPWPW